MNLKMFYLCERNEAVHLTIPVDRACLGMCKKSLFRAAKFEQLKLIVKIG